ncbi:MAG: VOC family protein [Bacteroidota bacterium]
MPPVIDGYIPFGFSPITPYLFVVQAESYIQFLGAAFGAIEIHRTVDSESGRLQNVILEISDQRFMIAEVEDSKGISHSAFYLSVKDAHQAFNRSLQAGATEVYPVGDTDYGDRQGGIQDPLGNYWWIAQRLVNKGYED